ncbi:MAG: acetylserotonin O-methyltransferase [Chloroflexota bacterium]|nr:acetylserotonin O-methyltransferase [Chloroflexota bacterium]MDQ6907480.1 acetylserotonin O-methyltransferase [Chloroflexota bacterium]
MEQPDITPSVALRRLVDGYQISQAIYVAATLGIADLLTDGPRTSDALAAATDADPGTLYRLLRALASVNVLREEEGHHFSLTPLGDCLRSDAPEPVRGWAAYSGRPYVWNAWADLLHSVKTGGNAFRHLHGMDVWEYRTGHPEENAIFNGAMTALSRRATASVLATYDFARFGRVVDVGGGRGALLAALLARHPKMRGILFDLPHVVANAEQLLRDAGVADRSEVVGGDFFAAVPEGGDTYILRAILHDWEDTEATAILSSCRRAIGAEGRLLVIEWAVGPPNEGRDGKFSDLQMLVAPGGQERTPEEYGTLFAAAGFRLTEVFPTKTGHTIIEGVPA